MIRRLVEKVTIVFAAPGAAEPDEQARETAIRMATAVLMTEVARADHEYDESEFDLLLNLITRHFQMSPEEAIALANEADNTAESSKAMPRERTKAEGPTSGGRSAAARASS